jgi:monoterpene epsilon-lactone hydrolase
MDNILNKVTGDRAFFNSLGNLYPADNSVEITSKLIEDVTFHWFVPDNSGEDKITICLHGGMFRFRSTAIT